MKDEEIWEIWGFILLFILACFVFFVGYMVAAKNEDNRWKSKCVERGYAEYNSTNGVWQWKEQNK